MACLIRIVLFFLALGAFTVVLTGFGGASLAEIVKIVLIVLACSAGVAVVVAMLSGGDDSGEVR